MTLTTQRFPEYFAALYGEGVAPYAWQQELADRVLGTGQWPEILDIPTGGGKSSVIDVHVFVNAVAQERLEAGEEQAPRIPRRLSTVVARRAIVDQQLDRALGIMRALDEAEGGILAEVRTLLARRSVPEGVPAEDAAPLRVHVLRGGAASVSARGVLGRRRDEWQDYPAAVQILCATPDMLGSRLLFRGYGASALSRPRSAGLLGYDHVTVIDEAHLSRQLVDTFRRVRTMCQRWNPVSETVPALQVCAATATHDAAGEGDVLSLDWSDLDPGLVPPLTRPKPVEYRGLTEWNGASRKAIAEQVRQVLEAVAELREEISAEEADGPVGVVLNRVATAAAVQTACETTGLRTRLLVGPMRLGAPRDLQLESIDLVVATQTVEVGVDMDCAGMVTDLAPGSALVQRAGRVNRRGRRAQGRLIVLGPDAVDGIQEKNALPYEVEDLRAARTWLEGRAEDESGVSPAAVREDRAPEASPTRPVMSHLDAADVRLFSKTSEDLVEEPDLTFWLRDSLTPEEQEIRVIGRRLPSLPENENERDEVLDATSAYLTHLVYDEGEVHPGSQRVLRQILDGTRSLDQHPVWVRRDGEWVCLQNEAGSHPLLRDQKGFRFRGGDLVVIASGLPCTMGLGESATASGLVLSTSGTLPIGDVSEPDALGSQVYFHGNLIEDSTNGGQKGTDICQDAASLMASDEAWDVRDLGLNLPDQDVTAYDIVLGPQLDSTDGDPAWVLLRRRDAEAQEEPLGPGTVQAPVTLTAHQEDVAERVRALAGLLDLPERIVEALATAARHHDDGKSAPEFQRMLRANGNQPVSEAGDHPVFEADTSFAKSAGLPVPGRVLTVDLPRGWRHEMYSAARFWAHHSEEAVLAEAMEGPELVTWLIGTHHGWGRAGFRAPADQVVPSTASEEVRSAARALFADGLWEDLAELADRQYGPWGISYLEAVLRAADVTISGEGR